MNLKIRQEIKADFIGVYEINTLAFGQENEAKLVNLLRESNAFIPELSLVAAIDNRIVGHILFSRIVIIDNNQNEFESLALAPIAIRPDYQKKGIGSELIRVGLDKARELKFKSVIVLGHEHYYPKFGFLPTNKWDIKSPFDVPIEAFMGIELIEDGLKMLEGQLNTRKNLILYDKRKKTTNR